MALNTFFKIEIITGKNPAGLGESQRSMNEGSAQSQLQSTRAALPLPFEAEGRRVAGSPVSSRKLRNSRADVGPGKREKWSVAFDNAPES
jgi:hypothetical protein